MFLTYIKKISERTEKKQRNTQTVKRKEKVNSKQDTGADSNKRTEKEDKNTNRKRRRNRIVDGNHGRERKRNYFRSEHGTKNRNSC